MRGAIFEIYRLAQDAGPERIRPLSACAVSEKESKPCEGILRSHFPSIIWRLRFNCFRVQHHAVFRTQFEEVIAAVGRKGPETDFGKANFGTRL